MTIVSRKRVRNSKLQRNYFNIFFLPVSEVFLCQRRRCFSFFYVYSCRTAEKETSIYLALLINSGRCGYFPDKHTFILSDHDDIQEDSGKNALKKKKWVVIDVEHQPVIQCSRCGIHEAGSFDCPHSRGLLYMMNNAAEDHHCATYMNRLRAVPKQDVEYVSVYHLQEEEVFIYFDREEKTIYHIGKSHLLAYRHMSCDCSHGKRCTHVTNVYEWISTSKELKALYCSGRRQRYPEYESGALPHEPIDLVQTFKFQDHEDTWERYNRLKRLKPKVKPRCEHGCKYEFFRVKKNARLMTPYKTWRRLKVYKAWALECGHGCSVAYSGESDRILNIDNLNLFTYRFLLDQLTLGLYGEYSYHAMAHVINATNALLESKQRISRQVLGKGMNRFLE